MLRKNLLKPFWDGRLPQMACVAMMCFLSINILSAQVVINEINASTNQVELKNLGNTMVPVGDYWLCDFPSYNRIATLNSQCGDLMLGPGELLTVTTNFDFGADDSEMGLYTSSAFGDANAIIDYVEWGSTGHRRASVAQTAGIWDASEAVAEFTGSASLEYSGAGDAVGSWTAVASETICAENESTACEVMGGEITTMDETTICVDGTPDPINVTRSGNQGTTSGWIITDDAGNILALPPAPPFDLDGAGPGLCLIWSVSYDDIEGLMVGNNASDLTGCFELSNSIAVDRREPQGGNLMLAGGGDALEICAGDGVSDAFNVDLADASGGNSAWVITDDQGTILALPPGPPFDLEGAGGGVCLVWHLSFEDGLMGAMVGNNAGDLNGCFDLSNPITVTRNGVNGGSLALASGQTETAICADGTPDPLDVSLTGAEGTNSGWVITDDQGNILALPPAPPFDLDPAGPGVCLIWHISFEDDLTGAMVGNNASQLSGCFDLSNPITVNRYEGVTDGGMLAIAGGATDIDICAGDGVSDAFDVELLGNVGPNSAWVITDDMGNILALPPAPPFDLEGAGGGVCLVWHLSFVDGLLGAAVGNNASDLAGCFSLSNPITVTRNGVNGGNLSTDGQTEIAICADGTPDPFDVELTDAEGTNSAWVITDDQGNILALPSNPPFDLDPAGPGVCLVWHLSFEDGLTGAEVGNNAADLQGCFDLSNPITVNRYEGETDGGMLMLADGGTDLEICAGDGVSDAFDVALSGNVGPNSAWVITDDMGNILALPPSPPFDLEGAGGGVCLVWHLSFIDGLLGAEVGNNAADLQGCFDLSNPITVTRNGVNGGNLSTDGQTEIAICADGTPDPFDVELTDAEGTNSAWVITDDQGNILALPPNPPFDLDPAGPGVCLVWHLSFEDGLTGAEVGNNAADLAGCFDLSNPITVNRYEGETDGGMLTLAGGGTDLEICAGDGVSDAFDVALAGNVGPNSAWVITDDMGNILALPPSPPFDLEGAGGGVCLVWHLSFIDGLLGAEVGNNAADLQGCFDLSNPITVTRIGVDGGDLLFEDGTTERAICADGTPDPLNVTLSGQQGGNSAWVITDDMGNILALPPSPPFDLDPAGPGVCLIWHLSFEDGLTGAEVGNNAADLAGCFALSNPLTVNRYEGETDGGMLALAGGGTDIEICAGDGVPDPFDVVLTGNVGPSSAWVITDDMGNILALPQSPPFDLEGAGGGVCLVWHLSFIDGLLGAEVGNNAADLQGCFDLSNPITVTRIGVDGGDLLFEDGTTERAICADGTPDPLNVTLAGQQGSNSAWVITDDMGNILALPPSPPFDLDPAGPGVCLIWHLSFEDGLTGAEVGNNAADLQGCFNLSNPITVNRYEGETDGGMLSIAGGGDEIEICAGDGVSDAFDVELTGNVGPNSGWVITDDMGNILALPPSPPFDLEGAGPGVCLVWHISFLDGILGVGVGNNAADLQGCFDLSNPITVIRNGVNGGTLALASGQTETAICVDGTPDPLDVTLTDVEGSNSAWVITDDMGNILALPPSPPFDLDPAGPGTCLIWHLSFEDGLTGAEVGNNASDLEGCFDLSNPITVVRNDQPAGGELAIANGETEITICAGDGEPDPFDVTLNNATGSNSAWVITDDAGNILALPPNPPFDLEGAGGGVCLVWHLSFEDGLTGAEVGNNASDLEGCFELSNPITVNRLTGDDCLTSNEEIDIVASFEVYPNPSTVESLRLEYQGLTSEAQLDIVSILGRRVYTTTVSSGNGLLSLEQVNLTPGQYIVRLTDGISQLSRKIIIE